MVSPCAPATLPAARTLPPNTARDCGEPCPTCAEPCLGGPVRYRSLHMCGALHQWGVLEVIQRT